MDLFATFEPIGRRPRKDGDEMDAFHRDPGPRQHSATYAKHRVTRRTRRDVRQSLAVLAR